MAEEPQNAQLQRLQTAFGVHDLHTLAIRLGVSFDQLHRWQDGTPIPWLTFQRAADLTGHPAAWLACRAGAEPRTH